MTREITEAEFLKLSELLGVSVFDLTKLYTMGALKTNVLMNTLIRDDFHRVKKMGKYKDTQIVTRLAEKYHVSHGIVKSALTATVKNKYCYCTQCHIQVGRSVFIRNDGLCNACMSKSIDI